MLYSLHFPSLLSCHFTLHTSRFTLSPSHTKTHGYIGRYTWVGTSLSFILHIYCRHTPHTHCILWPLSVSVTSHRLSLTHTFQWRHTHTHCFSHHILHTVVSTPRCHCNTALLQEGRFGLDFATPCHRLLCTLLHLFLSTGSTGCTCHHLSPSQYTCRHLPLTSLLHCPAGEQTLSFGPSHGPHSVAFAFGLSLQQLPVASYHFTEVSLCPLLSLHTPHTLHTRFYTVSLGLSTLLWGLSWVSH